MQDDDRPEENEPSSMWERGDFLISCFSVPLVEVALVVLGLAFHTNWVARVGAVGLPPLAVIASAILFRVRKSRIALGLLTGAAIALGGVIVISGGC